MDRATIERSGSPLSRSVFGSARGWVAPAVLLGSTLAAGAGLAAWKYSSLREADAAAANQPEPMESITAAVATEREHRPTITAVGTVLALQSVTLRNELPGTVREVRLTPGRIVEKGELLVALDVSVEQAELKSQEAEAALAETVLKRLQGLVRHRAVSQEEVDRARAERDVALAQIARTRAVIERKMIRAPFRSRVGISDVHPGQYLAEGTTLTTLQGVGSTANIDFTVSQRAASGLRVGDSVSVVAADSVPITAHIVAIDSRVDPTTRNATVRARIAGPATPAPGASVRVQVPVGRPQKVVSVPVNALRKGPGGDHVFVLAADSAGKTRAHQRAVVSGPILGREVLILQGLKPGEQVATSGSFKLREAVLVAIADTTKQSTSAEESASVAESASVEGSN